MFKRLIQLLIILFLLAGLALAGSYVYLNTNGKRLVEENLSRYVHKPVTIQTFVVAFPCGITMRGVSAGEMNAQEIYASLNPLRILSRELVVETLAFTEPAISIKKTGKGVFINDIRVPQEVPKEEAQPEEQALPAEEHVSITAPSERIIVLPAAQQAKTLELLLKINKIVVKQGTVSFTDLTQEEPFAISMTNLNVTVKNIDPDFARDTAIKAVSDIHYLDTTVKDAFRCEGTVNLRTRYVKLQFVLDGLPYDYFKNYYPPFWKPEALGVEKALFRLNSSMYTEDEKLVIKSALALKELKFKPSEDAEKTEKYEKISKMITSIVSAFQGGKKEFPTFDFKVSMDMNNPQFNFDQIREQFRRQARITIPLGLRVAQAVTGGAKQAFTKVKDVSEGTAGVAKDTSLGILQNIKTFFQRIIPANKPTQ